MKRISTYLILLLTTFVAGCEMDQYPYSEIAAEDYVKDAEAVNTLVAIILLTVSIGTPNDKVM